MDIVNKGKIYKQLKRDWGRYIFSDPEKTTLQIVFKRRLSQKKRKEKEDEYIQLLLRKVEAIGCIDPPKQVFYKS